jgi:hypothetical protein
MSGTASATAGNTLSMGVFNQTAGTFNDGGYTITVTGTGASTWTKSGTYTASGTVNFTGASPQIGVSNFNNLQISVGSTATLTGNATVAGNLTVSTGTFDLSGNTANRSGAGGTLTVTNGASLKIGGTNTFPTNYTAHTLGASSTVEYSGSAQTVSGETYGNLTLSGSGTKTMPGSVMNIGGNFTMDGTASATAGANITVTGNLILNSSSQLIIPVLKDLTVSGSTTINSTDGLYLKSDDTGSASFIDNGTISGTAKVERYLTGSNWHIVSSPTTDATANVFLNAYLKRYNELTHDFEYITSVSDPLTPMKGFFVWVDPISTNVFSGTLNTGPLNISVSRTWNPAGWSPDYIPGYDGWNLVGNPYPSAVDLSLLTGSWTSVEATAWFWDPGAGVYKVYPSGGGGSHLQYCPPEQGFFVHNYTGSSGTVIMNHAARVHNGEGFLKASDDPANLLRITAAGTINSYNDELSVYFNDNRTQGYEPGYDAWKYSGLTEAPQIYTLVNNQKVSVNALPFSQKNITIPMGFTTNIPGNYTLVATNLGSFDEGIDISLEDLKLSVTQDLRMNPVYNFSHDTTNDPNRFVLHFYNPSFGIAENNIDRAVQIFSFGNAIYIKSQDGNLHEGTVFVYDLIGKELFHGTLSNQILNRFSPNVVEGYYLVRVMTDAGTYNGKVYLRRS